MWLIVWQLPIIGDFSQSNIHYIDIINQLWCDEYTSNIQKNISSIQKNISKQEDMYNKHIVLPIYIKKVWKYIL